MNAKQRVLGMIDNWSRPVSASEIQFCSGFSYPEIKRALRQLRRAGQVAFVREGCWIGYTRPEATNG